MTDTQGNKTDNNKFLSRGIDYLGDLGAKLRDLQGFKTLAHELIQNADDAPTATSMVFDICDDAIVVDNNGVFSDCRQVENAECPWKTDSNKGYRCDFHRFRYIAAGDKRGEAETTGAFGIGFIAVYQITDSPELISGGRHWILHEDKPENERIVVCSECSKCTNSDLPGTRFILPWAFDPQSVLRKALMADAVSHDGPDRLLDELLRSLPTAMLFLKRLRLIEVKRNGIHCCKYERKKVDNNNLIISQGNADKDQIWYLIPGDFFEVAKTLRSEHSGRIEDKRSSKVSIAIPIGTAHPGVLCACLPTEQKTDLPFHINADFFPTNDRKRVILDNGYQAKWNKAVIEASAQLLGNKIDLLPQLLKPADCWRFLEQIKNVYGNDENLFGKFWEYIKPQLKITKIVFISIKKWVVSRDAVLLLQKEEKPVISILENMGLNVVHEDLRPYQSLLRAEAVGVPLLDIARICQAFTKIGMVQRIEADKCPPFFANRPDRISMWQEINLLFNRQQRFSKKQGEDIEQLKKISFAPGRDGAFWPSGQLFRADEATITLFQTIDESIPFVADNSEFAPLAEFLCPDFTVVSAIECLQKLDQHILTECWKSNQINLKQLFDWFEERRDVILNDENIKSAFTSVHIFPSFGKLNKLSNLTIPGDFDDPLGLAKIVDLTAIGKHREFLINLGMQELDFRFYAKQQLPAALQNQEVLLEKRRNAIKLLADQIGKIKDDQEVRDALAKSRLVECMDGEFHQASICYFDTQAVRGCLGDDVSFVKLPSDHQNAIRDLYKWIGVADESRYSDLVQRIQTISNSPYSLKYLQIIEKIIDHLGKKFDKKDGMPEELEPLKYIPWLPAEGKTDQWYKPSASELYTVFRKYLFETQALFLGISRNIQKMSSSFLGFLGVKSEPTAKLVVKHLLYCAAHSLPVNNGVYNFLNDNANDPALGQLNYKKCLYFEGEYLAPSQVFWGEHRFGRYRRRLGEDLRAFNKLLKCIGVRDTPDHEDALNVLREISEAFGTMNKPIDDDSRAVLLECWRMLENGFQSDELTNEALNSLNSVKCVPDDRKVLNQPINMFFENRAGLAEKFGDFIKYNVIPKPLGAGKAMEAAGVRPLGSAVKVQLLEYADQTEGVQVKERILKRENQLGRVLEGNDVLSRLELLENLKYIAVTSLQIKYILDAFKQQRESKPESVSALYQKEKKQLFFVHHNGQPPWIAVAREIAVALFPEEDPGKIALQLKAVLAPDSDKEVELELDMSGFPPSDIRVARPSQSETIVDTLGAETSPTSPLGQLDGTSSPTHRTGVNGDGHRTHGSGKRYEPQVEPEISDKSSKKSTDPEVAYTEEFDYGKELNDSFNKPGKAQNERDESQGDGGEANDSERRRDKIEGRIKEDRADEPHREKRFTKIPRKVWEGKNYEARIFLHEQYKGKCQICDQTFIKRNGQRYFEGLYLVSRTNARWIDREGNILCLCANHSAQFQHGSVEAEDINKQIQSFKTKEEGGKSKPVLRIKLCGEKCIITYKEKHLLDLQELLRSSKSDNHGQE